MKTFIEETKTYAGESSLEVALKQMFKTQGDMYSTVFGVSVKDASKAGWHPEDNNFNIGCLGFETFIEDKGICKNQICYLGYSKEELKLAIQILLFKEPMLQRIQLSLSEDDLEDVLTEIYNTQGDMYNDLFNIDEDQAENMNWHPEDCDFNTDCCGFTVFIENKGVCTFAKKSTAIKITPCDYDVNEIKETIITELFN